MLLVVSRMMAARRPGGDGGAGRASEAPNRVEQGRGAGFSPAVRLLLRGRASRAFLRALLSCTEVKVSIPRLFQTFLPPGGAPWGRFPLIFQRLGRGVKRCCSIPGLLLPSQSVRGDCPELLHGGRAYSPLRPNRRASLQGQSSKPKSQRSADVPPDTFVSPPAEKVIWPEEQRDAPALAPAPFAHSPQRTHLQTSGLAPNRPEPVTWLPHLPTKITT